MNLIAVPIIIVGVIGLLGPVIAGVYLIVRLNGRPASPGGGTFGAG